MTKNVNEGDPEKQMMRNKDKTKERSSEELQKSLQGNTDLDTLEVRLRQAEQAPLESKEGYQFLVDHIKEIVLVLNKKGNIIFANKNTLKDFGYSKEELIGKSITHFLTGGSITKALYALAQEFLGRPQPELEVQAKTKSAEIRYLSVAEGSAPIHKNGKLMGVMISANDITERRRAEKERQEAEKRFRDLWENAPVAYHTVDTKGIITNANQTEANMLGYAKEELVGKSIFEFILPEQRAEAATRFQQKIVGHRIPRAENRIFVKKDGSKINVAIDDSLERDGDGKVIGIRTTLVDITKLKVTEESLKKSEEHFRALVEKSGIAISIDDEKGNLIYCNSRYADNFGYSMEEMRGQPISVIVHSDDVERVMTYHTGRLQGKDVPSRYEFKGIRKDGSVIYLEVDVSVLREGERLIGTRSYMWDITERKRAEGMLVKSEKRFRQLSDLLPQIVFETDIKGNLTFANQYGIKLFGYSREDFQSGLNIFVLVAPEDGERIEERFKEILSGSETTAREYRVMRKDGGIFPILLHAATILEDGVPIGVRGIGIDITERKQAEDELRQASEKIRQALGSIVNVVTATIEMKDPNTAGHQKRVADLARAIATEMSLSKDQIEGIRIAGTIHDLGKIFIPGEVLSKPGKLNEFEFSLIKLHPQAGFDILKDIKFPWPIAQIVYQHHERMDGSGYPQGLKRGQILIEARILGVTDVVEAMSSHRPYRPALGIAAALEEIEKNRSILYDPDVVSACLTLFREKGFNFE